MNKHLTNPFVFIMTQRRLHQNFSILPLVVCLLPLIRGQYEPYGDNVALNKRATQSTTYEDYNASLGVDGNTDTDFDRKTCSHTNTGVHIQDAWWIVYLGEFYFVKFITIFQPKGYNRLDGATMYVKGEDGTIHQIQFISNWSSPAFNVSVLCDVRIDEIKLYNNKKPPLDSPMISVCELQAYEVLECSPYTIANGCIQVETLGEKNQNFTYGSKLHLSCNEGYEISEKGEIINETKTIVECKATKSWSRNLSCSVIDCGQPMNIPYNSTVISSTGLAGNTSYNATMQVVCDKGFNYTLPGNETIRCTDEGKWNGILGHCKVIDCGQPVNIPNNSTLIPSNGLAGNTSYNASMRVLCDKGFNYTLPGNDTIRCTDEGKWIGILGHCEVIDCGQPVNIPNNSTVISSNGVTGNTSYNATMRVVCDNGFNYTLPGNDTIRCADEGKWIGILGHCNVTGCTEIVHPEYGVIVVEAGPEGRWSFNTTVAIICNTGYSLNGEKLIKCLETGRWTNALGYCTAFQKMNAVEDESKTSLLAWIIAGTLCPILLVTNIATCLRLRRHTCLKTKKRNNVLGDVTNEHRVDASDLRFQAKEGNSAYDFVEDSNMEALKKKSNESENFSNAIEHYDSLQMENRAKSEYDQLTF